ncbi:MAG TPA: OmpA family protein [Telluria sp.]
MLFKLPSLVGGTARSHMLLRATIAVIIVSTSMPSDAWAQRNFTARHVPEEGDQVSVYFESNRSRLTNHTKKILSQVATSIVDRGATRVTVTGHADAVGSEESNLTLSMRRAQAVVTGLTSLGIPSTILVADWKGEFMPDSHGDSAGTAPLNRRVVIELEFTK